MRNLGHLFQLLKSEFGFELCDKSTVYPAYLLLTCISPFCIARGKRLKPGIRMWLLTAVKAPRTAATRRDFCMTIFKGKRHKAVIGWWD